MRVQCLPEQERKETIPGKREILLLGKIQAIILKKEVQLFTSNKWGDFPRTI